MEITEIILISVSLAMDAFAVSICKGLAMKKMKWNKAIIIALYFGIFQALMPVIGYQIGIRFQVAIESIDHWIAFILLTAIGVNMIKDALENDEKDIDDKVDFKTMLVLAVATSIDALAVGVTFAFLEAEIVKAVVFIGLITFVMSLIGVKIGNIFENKFKNKAEILGGCILIIIGVKILLEHLGVIV